MKIIKEINQFKKTTVLMVVMSVFISFCAFFNPSGSIMSNPVIDTAIQIVDKSSMQISPYSSIDVAYKDEKFYSSLPIGASLIAIPYYFLFKKLIEVLPNDFLLSKKALEISLLTPHVHSKEIRGLHFFLVFTFIFPLTLFLIVLSTKFFISLEYSKNKSLLLSLLFIFGSMFFSYAGVYSRQVLASLFIWIGLLLNIVDENKSLSKLLFYSFLMNYSLTIDYLSLLVLLPINIYFLYKLRNNMGKQLIFIFGAGICISIVLIHHQVVFGNIFSTPYDFRASYLEKFSYSIDFNGNTYRSNDSNFINKSSMLYFSNISLSALWGLLFSTYKGIFLFIPVLLIAPWSLYSKIRDNKFSIFEFCLLTSFLLMFLYNASLSDMFYWGGAPFYWGPRYLLSTTFLIFLLVFINIKLSNKVLFPLSVLTILVSFIGSSTSYLLVYQFAQDYDWHLMNPIYYGLKVLFLDGINFPITWFFKNSYSLRIVLFITILIIYIITFNKVLNDKK